MATKETYYVAPEVHATEDYHTKMVTVKAKLGLAPNAHTPVEYPIYLVECGYFNKTTTRRVVASLKRELLTEAAKLGYRKKDFTEPLRVRLFWERT